MHVFISHRNTENDRNLTKHLVHYLSQRGVMCWVDFEDMRAGDWREQIERARRTASAYIVVISEDLLIKPEECVKELVNILESDKRDLLIPFFADEFYFENPEIADKYRYELGWIGSRQGVKLHDMGETQAFERIYMYLPNELKENSQNLEDFQFSRDLQTLENYVGNSINVEIMGVNKIGERAFLGNENIQRVIISDSVVSIGKYAFAQCTSLCFAEGGNGITECSSRVVEKDSPCVCIRNDIYIFITVAIGAKNEIKEMVIPDGVRVIASGAFKDMYKLEKVILPESVISIGAGAFEGCIALKEINIRETVQVGKNAFRDCLFQYNN